MGLNSKGRATARGSSLFEMPTHRRHSCPVCRIVARFDIRLAALHLSIARRTAHRPNFEVFHCLISAPGFWENHGNERPLILPPDARMENSLGELDLRLILDNLPAMVCALTAAGE